MKSRLCDGPRFLGQRNKSGCGPVALLNLHKWQGRKVTRRDLPRYTALLGCCRRHGTPAENFSRTTQHHGYVLTYRQFKREINCDKAAVLLTKTRRSWHYYLVVGIGHGASNPRRQGFIAINTNNGRGTVSLINWPYMKWLLKHSTVWLFERKPGSPIGNCRRPPSSTSVGDARDVASCGNMGISNPKN